MKTIVVKLGGCNGSGKTSVVRALMDQAKYAPLRRGAKIVGYHSDDLDPSIIVLGRYETACGGMDSINNKEEVRKLFHHYVRLPGILVMEGLIVGKTYGYLGEELYNLGQRNGTRTLWAFMGTPFEECAERVQNRRAIKAALAGKEPPPFDAERTMRQTFTIMERLEAGVRSGKYPIVGEVLRLEYRDGRQPSTHAKQLLKKALEMYHDAS